MVSSTAPIGCLLLRFLNVHLFYGLFHWSLPECPGPKNIKFLGFVIVIEINDSSTDFA